jgi:hypothetical protein
VGKIERSREPVPSRPVKRVPGLQVAPVVAEAADVDAHAVGAATRELALAGGLERLVGYLQKQALLRVELGELGGGHSGEEGVGEGGEEGIGWEVVAPRERGGLVLA